MYRRSPVNLFPSTRNKPSKCADKVKKSPPSTFALLKEFGRENTIHGLRYVFRDGASITDRFCWVAALVTCVVFAAICVSEVWKQFSCSPIVVSVETTNFPLYKVPFPAITICPSVNVKKRLGEQLLSRLFNRSLSDDTFRLNMQYVLGALSEMQYPLYYRSSNTQRLIKDRSLYPVLNNITLSDFMLQVLPTCNEMFRGCNWIGRPLNCCESLSIQRSEAGFCYSFNSLSGDSTKNCTQNLPEEFLFEAGPIQKNDCNLRRNIAAGLSTGLEIFLDKLPEEDSLGKDQMYPNGFQIMVNHPLVPPESSKSIYVPELPGHFFTVKISYSITKASQELRGMNIISRNCLFPDERKSKYFVFYTYETCLLECRIRHIIDKCKCYPHFFNINEDGVPECNFEQLLCMSNENPTMRAFNPPGKHDWQEKREDLFLNCSCLPTCHEASFDINYDSFPDTNPYSANGSGHLDIFYKELGAIKYRRQLAFNFMNLIVSFGGFMGLFLGMSLLSVFELLYYFLKILLNLFHKKFSRDSLEKGSNIDSLYINRVPRIIYPTAHSSVKPSIDTHLRDIQMFRA